MRLDALTAEQPAHPVGRQGEVAPRLLASGGIGSVRFSRMDLMPVRGIEHGALQMGAVWRVRGDRNLRERALVAGRSAHATGGRWGVAPAVQARI